MAIVVSGLGMGFSGSIGNLTFKQQPDGTTTVSTKCQASDRPSSVPQLGVQQETKVMGAFMKIMKDFVKSGYEIQGKIEKMNQNNAMVKYLRKHAFTGVGQDRHFDFSKVLITRGDMPTPVETTMSITGNGLLFNWNTEIHSKKCHFSDQIMMLAYFPELAEVRYMTAGAQRHHGQDMLMLSGVQKGHIAEVYIAFVADNRKSISDSLYMGQIIWE